MSAPLPYLWLLLPAWLVAHLRRRPSGTDAAFLTDILFGQYALFLFIRIHDDLLDRHVRSPWLLYVADRYLIEAETAFAAHLTDRRFWRIFRSGVAETLDGIATSHALQRRRRPDVDALLQSYASVASIFKIGSAAVLVRYGGMPLYRRVAAFKDELAIASQVFDDLEDIDEDAADGRRNFAAVALRGPGGVSSAFTEIERRFRSAARVIRPVRLAAADRHVARQLERLDAVRAAVHRDRVRRVFGRVDAL